MSKLRLFIVLGSLMSLLLVRVADAQGTFKPRNADEVHAWRLYHQYRASKQQASSLQARIAKQQQGIRVVGLDSQEVAELTKMREQLVAARERQQKLEQAWGKQFGGHYGDLKDSGQSIYDPKTRQHLDRIRFRLIYFPFYVLNGTYTGKITGASGTISLTVAGRSVSGRVSGTYYYTSGGEKSNEPFFGTIDGSVGTGGSIQARMSGKIGLSSYTGSLTGIITNDQASGSWSAQALTPASGNWSATKQQTSLP